MRIVLALGGNALLRRGEALTAENQRANMRAAAEEIARVCDGNEIAIVHGNGPQVGLLALEAAAYEGVSPYPLDILGAESQGMIGYVIAQELRNARPNREIATVLTQTLVDPADAAFQHPTKPIGPVYAAQEAEALRARRGWSFASDGAGVRRVVASPIPVGIVELPIIERLMSKRIAVICAGGGGVPVRATASGAIEGVEAVVDKDFAAALIAERLHADRLIILTDVDAIYLDWGTPAQRPLHAVKAAALERMEFAPGSMAPKAAAASRFVRRTERPAAIGALAKASEVLAFKSGTIVRA